MIEIFYQMQKMIILAGAIKYFFLRVNRWCSIYFGLAPPPHTHTHTHTQIHTIEYTSNNLNNYLF